MTLTLGTVLVSGNDAEYVVAAGLLMHVRSYWYILVQDRSRWVVSSFLYVAEC